MKSARSSNIALALAFLLLGAAGILGYSSTTQVFETVARVKHTHEVRQALDAILRDLVAAQSARRGFALTRHEVILRGYPIAIERVRAQVANVRRLTSDDREQQRRLEELAPLIEHRIEMMDAAIRESRERSPDQERDSAGTMSGEALTEMVASGIGRMIEEEERLLQIRERSTADLAALSRIAQVAVVVSSVLLVGIVLARLRKELALRARSEQAVRASEEVLATTLHSIGDGVISTDADQRIVLLNPVAEALTGWSAAEAKDRKFDEVFRIVHETTREPAVDPVEEALRRGVVVGLANHVALVSKSGTETPIADSAAPIRDGSGGIRGAVIVFRDVSAERAADARTVEANAMFDRFFTLSLDLLCIASTDGYFKRLNPAFASLGYAPEELLSKPFVDFVHPQDVPATLAEVAKLAEGAPTIRFENRYRCKDGSYQWLAWTTAPDPTGALYAVARNVTDTKRAEEELRRARDAAEAANGELEAFSYSVAHDLRAPLRGINGFAQALLEDYAGKLDSQADDYLRRIVTGSERMGLLIDALLSLSRVSRSEMHRQPVALGELAEGIVSELRSNDGGSRVVELVRPGDRLLVHGDPVLLRALLENLLGNAWKFTGERALGRIELGSIEVDDGEKHYFVRDNGAGFDMKYAAKLFVPFQRLHASTQFSGTGIGLATVQRIVRRHGGRVWAESAPGEGATFYFTVPSPGDTS